jgi:SAM-dependent methyltransferase
LRNAISRLRLSLGSALPRVQGSAPHFVCDCDFVLSQLLSRHDFDLALQASSGGNYEGVGQLEADILVDLGLRDGHSVVDVGCGSGRLSTAIQRKAAIDYHGTAVLRPALDYARSRAPSHYRFTRVAGLDIPVASASADFVVFFSVATHLMHHETYIYPEEAKRVAKPGGRIVTSFLVIGNPEHWPAFAHSVASRRRNNRAHLNAFIEPAVFPVWAERLNLELVAIHRVGAEWIPLTGDATMEDGRVFKNRADLSANRSPS